MICFCLSTGHGEIQRHEVVLQGLGQGFLSTATPAILLVGSWDNEISFHFKLLSWARKITVKHLYLSILLPQKN